MTIEAKRTGRFVHLSRGSLSPAQVAVVEQLTDGPRGKIPTPFNIWLSDPELAACMERISVRLLTGGLLSHGEREMVVLATAAHLNGEYVIAAHRRQAREAGLADEMIENLCSGRAPMLADPRQQTILTITACLLSAMPVTQALYEDGAGLLGYDGLVELIFLVGHYITVIHTFNVFAVLPATLSAE